MLTILSEKDVEVLAHGVCTVLERQGFHCENDDLLDAYEQAGALIDRDAHVAKFPRRVVMDFAECVRDEDKSGWHDWLRAEDKELFYSGYHPYEPPSEFKAPLLPYMFHSLSTYYYDDETTETRLGNRDDFLSLIRLGDVLHPEKGVGHVLNLSADTDAPVEPLESALLLLEHSNNPRGVYVMDIRQIPYLEEIEAIFGIDDPYWHWMANICPSSPLKLDRLAAERYVYMLRKGIHPAKMAAMPVAGVNMPVTTAGTVVVIAAEFVALWLAARVLQSSKVPLTGMPVLGTLDLSNGDVSFTAFDAAIRRLAICEFVRKWVGVQLAPGPGEWTPTKGPGSYCTLEKAYFAMICAAFTGHHPEIGIGHIDAGLTISPVQLLLDWEFTKSLSFLEKPTITEENLGLDAILDVGFGFGEDFLTSDHTITHMRRAVWMPECVGRGGWSPEAEEKLLQRTLAKARGLMEQYSKPEVDPGKLVAARAVIERARQALCD